METITSETAEVELMAGFEAASADPEGLPATPHYLTSEQNVEIDAVVRAVVGCYRRRGVDFYFAGNPIFLAEIQRDLMKDLARMIPLSFLLIIIFLAALFRRLSGVVSPLIIVFASLVSSLGIMATDPLPFPWQGLRDWHSNRRCGADIATAQPRAIKI